jgi:hypothetical protein
MTAKEVGLFRGSALFLFLRRTVLAAAIVRMILAILSIMN